MSKNKKSKNKRYLNVIRVVAVAAIITFVVVALLTHYIFPIVRIYGSTMSPTLFDGDVAIALKTTSLERGDICIFQIDDTLLCKRVIGIGGDEINIDESGTVYVNGKSLDEPYLNGKSLGNSTVAYPVVVPENEYFVIGDNRRISVDSRNITIGCISSDQVIGKLLLRILPLPAVIK